MQWYKTQMHQIWEWGAELGGSMRVRWVQPDLPMNSAGPWIAALCLCLPASASPNLRELAHSYEGVFL